MRVSIDDEILKDIADSIREKNGSSDTYSPQEMPTEILDIQPTLQSKSVTITSNTTTSVTPDEGYDGLELVTVETNVQPNLQNKSVTITSNTTTNVTPDTGYDGLSGVSVTTNISGGDNIHDYFTSQLYSGNGFNEYPALKMIKSIPADLTLPNNCSFALYKCINLETVPQLNTSNVTMFSQMFNGCTNLANVPVFDTTNVMFMANMFVDCPNLTDASLNNILTMCINAGSNYSNAKELSALGFTSTNYPASRIQALSNYSAFTSAGWTIGY